jgi:hypothetical protein
MVSHFSIKPDHLSESNINGPGGLILRRKAIGAMSRLTHLSPGVEEVDLRESV